jgi:hypothetical protein
VLEHVGAQQAIGACRPQRQVRAVAEHLAPGRIAGECDLFRIKVDGHDESIRMAKRARVVARPTAQVHDTRPPQRRSGFRVRVAREPLVGRHRIALLPCEEAHKLRAR